MRKYHSDGSHDASWGRWAATSRPVDPPRSRLDFRHQPCASPRQATSARSPSVANNTSKTARASVRAGQTAGGALSVLGEFKYLIPLAGGRFAYVRNLTNGKTNHLRTDSPAFAEEIRGVSAGRPGARIRAELAALAAAQPTHGWDATEKRLIDAGVF